jgi:alkylhydroperoxidase family enzyme
VPRIDPQPDVRGPMIARMLGRRAPVLEGFLALDAAFRERGLLSAELKEAVRRSTAEGVGCRYCASLGEPQADHPDRREALAVGFAQLLAQDAGDISDGSFELLREEFSDEEIVELIAWTCIVVIGGQKFGAALGLEPASPEEADRYQRWVAGAG